MRLLSKSFAPVALPAASVAVAAVLLSVPDGRCSTPWLTWLGAFWLGLALALALAGAGAAASNIQSSLRACQVMTCNT